MGACGAGTLGCGELRDETGAGRETGAGVGAGEDAEGANCAWRGGAAVGADVGAGADTASMAVLGDG